MNIQFVQILLKMGGSLEILIISEESLSKYENKLISVSKNYDVIDIENDLIDGIYIAKVFVENI